jgi:hypothetical protein
VSAILAATRQWEADAVGSFLATLLQLPWFRRRTPPASEPHFAPLDTAGRFR